MEGTIGEIRLFGGNFAPANWMFCTGQSIAIAQYEVAFSILGTVYGGDGHTTFNLPNLQGRVPVGTGTGGVLPAVNLAQIGGAESVTLSVNNLPVHTHAATFTGSGGSPGAYTAVLKASANAGTETIAGNNGANTLAAPIIDAGLGSTSPANGYVSDPNPGVPLSGLSVTQPAGSGGGGTVTNANMGGSQPIKIMKPYLALNYIICMVGIYPSRN